jgi:hypothetical protein
LNEDVIKDNFVIVYEVLLWIIFIFDHYASFFLWIMRIAYIQYFGIVEIIGLKSGHDSCIGSNY